MSISINLTFAENDDAPIPEMVWGGLQIEIRGEPLLRYDNPDEFDGDEWRPEYLGRYIIRDVQDLLTTATEIVENSIELYETTTVNIGGTRNDIVLEQLSEDLLRIAFHVRAPYDDDHELHPAAEAERGYLVGAEEFGRAVLACGQEFQSYLDDLGFDSNDISYLVDCIQGLETALE